MDRLWRLQTNTDNESGVAVGTYCVDHGVLAVGWSLNDEHLKESIPEDKRPEAKKRRAEITTFDDFNSFVYEYHMYHGKVNSSVRRLVDTVETDDLIWLRQSGVYYLGRITEKSHWFYDSSNAVLEMDASNQVSDVEWLRVGDESSVPGAITTSMIRGRTLQIIHKDGMLDYSKLLYNSITGKTHYKATLTFDASLFYNLLSTEDCEDLLCMWLYHKYGYIAIPSTNKKSTPLYECVLIDPQNGRHIYPQAKAGGEDLRVSDYEHLDGEAWLFTTKGHIIGAPTDRIRAAEPKELFDFISTPQAKTILPNSILKWYSFLEQYK